MPFWGYPRSASSSHNTLTRDEADEILQELGEAVYKRRVQQEGDRHGDEDVMGDIGFPSVEPAGETSPAQRSYGRYVRDLWRDHVGIKRHDDAGEHLDNWFSKEYIDQRNREQPLHLVYSDECDGLMLSDEEVEIWVASDSGAVDHVCGPGHIPGTVVLRQPSDGKLTRNFISASGGSIKNHGAGEVNLITEEGNVISSTFQVADVCRPLHSVSKTCDQGHEMLYTSDEALVLPAGVLSKLLATLNVKPVARYVRRGGLYVAKMKARDGVSAFIRPGAGK